VDGELDAGSECGPHRCVAPLRVPRDVTVDVHGGSAHRAGDLSNDLDRVAGAHEQRGTVLAQARIKGAEVGEEQVPAEGTGRGEHGGIEDEEGEDLVSSLGGGGPSGVVGQAEIPPEPDDRCRQELRPMLGLRPWLAFLRRTLAFFLLVRFDIGLRL
jgi:hypothetical protein